MKNKYFTRLFDYDSTMNRKVLDLLRGLPSVSERTRNVFAHILAAKKVWNWRLRSLDSSDLAIWPTHSLDECEALIEENKEAYTTYLQGKSEADLNSNIQYRNSKGIKFENSVQDVLMHVLIHSGYHRGQIAKAVRASGEEPVNTDYIFQVREQVPIE